MSYLRKLDREKHYRVSTLANSPLVHDAKYAHQLAFNNNREARKLIEETRKIDQEKAKWDAEARKAEQMILQTAKRIAMSSGRLNTGEPCKELPSIVLTGPGVRRSKLNIRTKKPIMNELTLIPKISEEQSSTRRKTLPAVFFPSLFKNGEEKNMKKDENQNNITKDYVSQFRRRRSDIYEVLTSKNSRENFNERRSSDSGVLLQKELFNDNNSSKWAKERWESSLQSPASKTSHHALWSSISMLDTVVEDVEEEVEFIAGRMRSRLRSGTL